MVNYFKKIFLICLLSFSFLANATLAQIPTKEKITNFDSQITVQADGSLIVQETITVNALGNEIKRGIYRDFPTRYRDRLGNNYHVDFKILEVLRNGEPDSYHTENLNNGIRTYIGKSDYYLPAGQYTYTFKYQTTRQIGFFTDHDELYWNVTGQGWVFPIDYTSAIVTLPGDINPDQIQTTGYTGPTGSVDQNFSSEIIDNQIIFNTTQTLNAYEGLTIVIGWPKGVIAAPTQWQKIKYFMTDNQSLIFSLGAILIILLYYFLAWKKVGRDPEKGTIIPQYEPPKNMSSGQMRYLAKMGFDNKVFVSEILDLAIKGVLTIGQDGKEYVIAKTTNQKFQPTEWQQRFIDHLIFSTTGKIRINQTHHTKIQDGINQLRKELRQTVVGQLFQVNLKYFLIGLFLSIILLLINFPQAKGQGLAALALIIASIIIAIINMVFFFLLKAPTAEGRKILDHIAGFKWFLTVTEKDRLNFHNPPNKTPELFEKFLPHALALGVEQKWAEQFSQVFAQLRQAGKTYAPIWYQGTNFNPNNLGDFSHSLSSSFTSAISAAAKTPGSSSGFGGGGFSGGGGGGGGGGGW
ncbi:MAG: DUF2207 domain-containing protein [Patescibacteria group bacterium]|jgi:uncharacterized membrane protein|nr:DUF2207 domain-containing protein [Patescibacteria group bacterium]